MHRLAPSTQPPSQEFAPAPSAQERRLEIELLFGDTVLDTLAIHDAPEVIIGDAPKERGVGPTKRLERCDLDVPTLGLPARRFPLVRSLAPDRCRYAVVLHPCFGGAITRADGGMTALSDLLRPEVALEEGPLPGTALYPLAAGETIWIVHGLLTFRIRYVRATRIAPAPLLDRTSPLWLNAVTLSFFLHTVLITAFLTQPTEMFGLDDVLQKGSTTMISTSFVPMEKRPKESLLGILHRDTPPGGDRAREGRAGVRHASPSERRRADRGDDAPRRDLTRARLGELLGAVGRDAERATLGLGRDLERALGGVRGRVTGDSEGLLGLGLRGAGPGGPGLGPTPVGIGTLSRSGAGGDDPAGRATSRLKKSDGAITVEPGPVVLMGGLDRELIRRVVDQHRAQIRYCYERALNRSPGLFGKAQIEWVIDASGAVSSAKVTETTIGDEVASCLAGRIRSWVFPPPQGGGVVVVRYPFVFRTAG